MGYIIDGEKLKELRTEKKITQEKLAESLGVRREYISNIECGNYWHDFSFDFIDRLSAMFGLTVYEMLTPGDGFEGDNLSSHSSFYYGQRLFEARMAGIDEAYERMRNFDDTPE